MFVGWLTMTNGVDFCLSDIQIPNKGTTILHGRASVPHQDEKVVMHCGFLFYLLVLASAAGEILWCCFCTLEGAMITSFGDIVLEMKIHALGWW